MLCQLLAVTGRERRVSLSKVRGLSSQVSLRIYVLLDWILALKHICLYVEVSRDQA